MSNRTWVCFECRQSVRRTAEYSWDERREEEILCPECRSPCVYLGYMIPLPPRRDVRAWQDLNAQMVQERIEEREASQLRNVRRKHGLEKEIAKLEARAQNPGLEGLIKQLRRRLRDAE